MDLHFLFIFETLLQLVGTATGDVLESFMQKKEEGFRVHITEEPIGNFCPSTSIFDEKSNKTTTICEADPQTVHLIVNWDFVTTGQVHYPGSNWDWVGLYEGYPENHFNQRERPEAIEWKWTVGNARGSTKTMTSFFGQQLRVNLTSEALVRAKTHPGNCLPFYAVYNRWTSSKQQYEVGSIKCHRIHPSWMERSWMHLESFSLKEILIPGSHDSGTATMLNLLASPFTRTQSLSFYRQLLYGVRYFDIRVALNRNSEDKFIIVHDVFWANTSVASLLDDVALFLSEFRQEVIILDFHHFLMGMERRQDFVDLLKLIDSKIGSLWIPFEDRLQTLGVLKDENKRVAIAWNCMIPSLCSPNDFHPRPLDGIPHVWPNTASIFIMKRLLRNEIRLHHEEIWVSQPIFTPVQIITDVSHLFSNFEWLNVNVVAIDFFQSNSLVDLAMFINELRWKLLLNAH